MIVPVTGNPAAAALALMIAKGGTIRLRRAEIEPMMSYSILIEPSERNNAILHFKRVSAEEIREMAKTQLQTKPSSDAAAS